MKKLSKFASIVIIGVTVLGAVGTASAWTEYNYATRATDCGEIRDVNANKLRASDGDVVTTTQWNQVACSVGGILAALADFGRLETPFIWGDVGTSTIGGKVGSVIVGIGLGYTTSGNSSPFIGFFDGDYGYKGAFGNDSSVDKPALGMIRFLPKSKGVDDSLRFVGFGGGIKIEPGTDVENANNGTYLLGWEKISLTDTSDFDVNCDYRFSTNIGDRRGYHASVVQTAALRIAEDSDWQNDSYGPQYLVVYAGAKSVLQHQMSIGIVPATHGTAVTSIEKLCLPSYNPNNI